MTEETGVPAQQPEESKTPPEEGGKPREKTFKEVQKEMEEDLRTNERYKAYLSQYNSNGAGSIDSLARMKADVTVNGKRRQNHEEEEVMSLRKRADMSIWNIQQRKLFDLQCKWRAGSIDLPGIETTYDFEYWSELIQRCPFLPPITQEEYDLYHDYVLSDDFDDCEQYSTSWQTYVVLKMWDEEEDDEDDSYPAWYSYYERFKGGHDWRLLPDTRGDKEHEYWRLAHKDLFAKASSTTVQDKRPYLATWVYEEREKFFKVCEPDLLRHFYAYEREADWEDAEDRLRQAIWTLLDFDEALPMEYNDDWKEGIFRAARRADQLRLAKACDAAFKEYLNREELGLKHEVYLDDDKIKKEEERRAEYNEAIRKGKALSEKGETAPQP